MSIFKESFKDFVRKQIKIREAIISHGNNPSDSRTKTPKVDLSNLGGPKELSLPSHAFYTNTVNRQCTIRMSSGVDLRVDNELIVDNRNEFERKDDLVNEGLALRYVLEGGTPAIDKSVEQISVETEGNKTTTKNKIRLKQTARSGFTGASKNKFGQTYGDPSIRANSDDGYGIVPMPGITDANIRTVSAYGGLREAQVNFVCHNLKQLEILELLYMRPGYPVLLEWGWTPFIDNDGERRNDFPYVSEWWDQNSSMEVINELVIKRKIDTGGNYDAVVGYVKNFNYTARPDGGFNCTTELMGIGETIEALKGRADIYDTEEGRFTTALEEFLKDILSYSVYADRTTVDAGEAENARKVDSITGGLFNVQNLQQRFNRFKKKILSAAEKYDIYSSPTEVFDYLNFNWLEGHENIPKVYGNYKDVHSSNQDTRNDSRKIVLDNFVLYDGQSLLPKYEPGTDIRVGKAIIYSDFGDRLVENIQSQGTYIRLDFFCHVMNQHIIEKNENGDSPIIYIKTDTIVHEDREVIVKDDGTISIEGKHIEPFAYCTNTISQNLKEEFKRLYNLAISKDRTNGWFGIGDKQFEDYYGDGAGSINDSLTDIEELFEDSDVTEYIKSFEDLIESDRIDASIDPTICLLPHQMKFLDAQKNKGKSEVEAFYKRVQPQFAYDGLGDPKNRSRDTRYDEYIKLCNYDIEKEKPGIYDRQIGHIYLNTKHLLRVYQSMRYDTSSSKGGTAAEIRSNLNFNLFDFFKQILKDVNDACGGQHKFTLQPDHERPNVMNIVDLIFQPEESINAEIKEGKVIELNIQSNDSIFRDYQYVSSIPSSLMATIGVVAQNPDAVGDLEQSTFSALNVNVRQRFAQKPKSTEAPRVLKGADLKTKQEQQKEEEEAAEAALFAERTAFTTSLLDTFKSYVSLRAFYQGVIRGEYSDIDSDGNPIHSKEIGKQKQNLKTVLNEISKISTRHIKDGKYEDGSEFKRGQVKRAPERGTSDIIPLKFQAVMDGIGGVVIGSTFKVNASRLPIVYRKTKGKTILFICMTEDQSITAGQDWTTSISGQLTILNDDPTLQNTGAKKAKGKGSGTGGGSVGTGNGDAGAPSGGGEKKNKIAEEKTPTIDSQQQDTQEPTQQEEQLNKQDQCPPGYYFDEVIGDCVLEDVVIEEEQESGKEAKAKERYDKWREQAIKYADNLNGMDASYQAVFEENNFAFGKLSSNQSYTIFYAYFENAIANAQSIKNLSTWKGQNIGPELEKLMFEEYDRDPKVIKLPNSNATKDLEDIARTAQQVHNVVDSKNAENLRKKWKGATNFGLQTILDTKTAGTFKANTANEEVILKYKDYYAGEVSEPTEPSNVVEVYRSIEIISPSAIEYLGGTLPNQPTPLQEYVYGELSGSTFRDLEEIKEEIDILIEEFESDTGEEDNQQKIEELRGNGTQYVGIGTSLDQSIASNKARADATDKVLQAAGVDSGNVNGLIKVDEEVTLNQSNNQYTATITFELQ